jgi:hypothetical protein
MIHYSVHKETATGACQQPYQFSPQLYHIFLTFILILSSHIRLEHPSGLFLSTKILHPFRTTQVPLFSIVYIIILTPFRTTHRISKIPQIRVRNKFGKASNNPMQVIKGQRTNFQFPN